jgi:hypothetical protein
MPGMVLGDVASRHGFTWLPSLPMWGSVWMGQLASCTILWPIAAKRGDMASLLGAVLSCCNNGQ